MGSWTNNLVIVFRCGLRRVLGPMIIAAYRDIEFA